jgi:hypothetical protein
MTAGSKLLAWPLRKATCADCSHYLAGESYSLLPIAYCLLPAADMVTRSDMIAGEEIKLPSCY